TQPITVPAGFLNIPEIELLRAEVTAPSGIEELRTSLAKWLSIPNEDRDLIDFCLAVYKSHQIPGDPLWGIIIDASGGGKTELLRAFRKRDDAYFLSGLSEKTLVSGYRDPKNTTKDPSLLPELNGKVLIIKDLSPLLSMRRESRNAIVSQLRDAYDGFTDQGRGNVGKVAYESRFSLITAATLSIDRQDTVDQELGERFIKFRCRGDASRSKVEKAIRNIGSDDMMREEIESAVADFFKSLPPIRKVTIADRLGERLVVLSDFTAKARSHVTRDRNGDLQYLPKPEVGTRLGKELGKLLIALAAVRGKSEADEQDLATVQRVAEDCLPPNRLLVINHLRGEPLSQADVERATGLPHKTADRILDDLRVLGVAEKSNSLWTLDHQWK
ncbi:MAG: hypothetical protein ACRD40_16715, partial [Candidatus Acidiferrales bacterium]